MARSSSPRLDHRPDPGDEAAQAVGQAGAGTLPAMLEPGVAQAGEAGLEPVLGPPSVQEPEEPGGEARWR